MCYLLLDLARMPCEKLAPGDAFMIIELLTPSVRPEEEAVIEPTPVAVVTVNPVNVATPLTAAMVNVPLKVPHVAPAVLASVTLAEDPL